MKSKQNPRWPLTPHSGNRGSNSSHLLKFPRAKEFLPPTGISQGTEGISDDFNQLCDAISAEDDDENDTLRKSKSDDKALRRTNTATL